jgi:hypothetical protein
VLITGQQRFFSRDITKKQGNVHGLLVCSVWSFFEPDGFLWNTFADEEFSDGRGKRALSFHYRSPADENMLKVPGAPGPDGVQGPPIGRVSNQAIWLRFRGEHNQGSFLPVFPVAGEKSCVPSVDWE